MGCYAQKVRGRTLVPAKWSFRLECLPQTVDRVLVQQADVSAVWHDLRGLVVHARQRGVRGLHDYELFKAQARTRPRKLRNTYHTETGDGTTGEERRYTISGEYPSLRELVLGPVIRRELHLQRVNAVQYKTRRVNSRMTPWPFLEPRRRHHASDRVYPLS